MYHIFKYISVIYDTMQLDKHTTEGCKDINPFIELQLAIFLITLKKLITNHSSFVDNQTRS